MLPLFKVMLISGLLGNETAEKVLLFVENFNTGYARQIATTFEVPVSQVQRQLERFELEGVVVSQFVGKTRVYQFNPRYLFKDELSLLLQKALKNLPPEKFEKYFIKRTRPRRKGKPL